MPRGNWNYPTRIWFGAGRLGELGAACREVGIARPLLVTDPALALGPVVASARAHLGDCPLFSEVRANPDEATVTRGLECLRSGDCDGVVALGGGSSLDAGKAIALMAGQERLLFDFEDVGDNYTRARLEGMVATVAVPTTAGTGSEVGRVSVITDTAAGVKRLIFHPRLQPALVLADPEVTLGLPPFLTAATGMDALAHCLEAICSPAYHPMADGIAREGLALIQGNLLTAFRDGRNLQARSAMLAAAIMGGTAFQKGLGGVHSLSHPLGAMTDCHHGLLNAILMPAVLRYNRPAIEASLGEVARGLQLDGFDGFVEWLVGLRRELGLAENLRSLGMSINLDEVARKACLDPSVGTNPRPLDEAAHRQILEWAW